MIQWLNSLSAAWSQYFIIWTVQNTIFLGIVLLLLYVLRNQNVRLLRAIAIIGFLKLLVPPIFFSQTVQSIEIVRQLPAITVTPTYAVADESFRVFLSGRSILLLIWAGVSISFILTSIIRLASLSFLRKSGKHINNPRELRSSSLPLIRLYSTEKISSPMIYGLLNYNLLVPASWKHMPETMQRAIIHHELAHLRQKDQFVGVLQTLGIALNFFHPLVWILNHQLNEYCEKACDDQALLHSNLKPKEYLNSLISMAELSRGSQDFYTPALAFTKSYKSLKSRIMHQVQRRYETLKLTPLNYLLITAVIAGLVIFSCDLITDNEETATSPPQTAVQRQAPAENPEVKFIPYDVPPRIVGGMQALKDNIKYPEPALQVGIEGTVIVQAFINEQGAVEDAVVVKGVPKSGLDEAAVEAVSATRFEPAEQKGRPVGVWYSVPITFRIKSSAHSLDIHINDDGDLTLNGDPVLLENLRHRISSLDPGIRMSVIISGHSDVNMALINSIHKELITSDHYKVTYNLKS